MVPKLMNRLLKGTRSGGFTLIELMIVITVVAILTALAVPAYRDYTIRSKITECVNGAAVAKLQVSEYRQSLGDWPTSMLEGGISLPSGDSRFCIGFTDYEPSTGAFTIDIDESAIGSIAGEIAPTLTPLELPNNVINWNCSYGSTPSGNIKYLPGPCRDS